ncbi:MAG: sulfatase-like hydrolase/transferase, partial [Acidimicrobiia bacterium]|nr:sulfatase-like hydrolase/transferase [Acidimicrobiia bacterium]
RASLYTGRYMAGHGVTENSTAPGNPELDPAIPTLGHRLRQQGYRTAYKGKWHLQVSAHPDMAAYGYGDWTGNDMSFWGLQGSGVEYDEPIARDAAQWLRTEAPADQPWFLTVGLVNPHDIMWFPADQQWFPDHDPRTRERMVEFWAKADWGRADNCPLFTAEVPERFTTLPENFADDLTTKPEVHRRWMTEMERQQGAGVMPVEETWMWRRQLDYYAVLHELSDISLGHILGALDDTDAWRNTIVVFTSDHGDQCGSHQLRSKGPWNYEETMRIPLYVVGPGVPAGVSCHSLTSHVDVAATIAASADVDVDAQPDLAGSSLAPLLADPAGSVRDHVLFAQDWPWYAGVEQTRYASTGMFDGRFKYCRYYGIGGGHSVAGVELPGPKRFGPDAAFEDHEHELYDLVDDPHEMVNLAADQGRRTDVRDRFATLLELERVAGA